MDNHPISAKSLEKYFLVNGSTLAKQYKHHLSGFDDWQQKEHAKDWVLFAQNIDKILHLDEVSLSDGELYTILTNSSKRTQKGSLIAIVKGVKSENIIKIISKIPIEKRNQVEHISVDMANNMEKIARISFPKAKIVTDRFHVAKLVSDAVQSVRIHHRWKAIEKENELIQQAKKKGQRFVSQILDNGDTEKQLLARSRYLLFKPESKWTSKQAQRAELTFSLFPDIQKAYKLSMEFRSIYQNATNKHDAKERVEKWFEKVEQSQIKTFNTAANSIKSHFDTILNYFPHRITNALAENFNSKLKAFRATFRGVTDIPFFIFRVSKIFA